MKKLVLATKNKDKVKEIRKIFELLNFTKVELLETNKFENVPDVEEDGKTLKENAIKKAKIIGNFTGLPSLAEDTGIFVDHLNGAPGVYSARYADKDPKKHTATYEDNYKKLLKELEGVPWEKRTAKFVCVSCLYIPKKNKFFTRTGTVKGYISFSPSGNHGFGYDPVFYYPPKQKTFAELTSEEKCCLSHRFIAIKKIIPLIKEYVL
ncbi:MAG: RdgB/HAM1 family non-canonical purine NTP pyrophosphatase [Endomicrobia bacterium]|nr:RdgB/HAM1 family non-canonical purine NTP pyrophosphatase [Endomicrobiia bacterium]MCX7940441.1 RdgB/HAM1 family non-canonical purine NTP pyrophosphatase [Endomicrobiia bacterium]MDW8055866.1 RdgB/HAM1 family non-canonical purine NTP pyrophosphatase [Elusimicrobiota bacterium]